MGAKVSKLEHDAKRGVARFRDDKGKLVEVSIDSKEYREAVKLFDDEAIAKTKELTANLPLSLSRPRP